MALIPGTRLGPYEILSLLGAGGMGEVYRARDSKLNRNVAIKVVPDLFSNDPERLARFQREAQVLASLNHPNIAHIHGLEEATLSGPAASPEVGRREAGHYRQQALVMELVEGEDLAQRIARGPIPLEDALPIARQIAEALEAAHEQGIIHRDLKPANIKVRSDGTVKVLDFGLAKALGPAEAGHYGDGGSVRLQADLTHSPTITSPAMMTGVGMILGTAAYMSPEQAKGRAVGRASDVWSFGCVLYEMLTARQVFEGETVGEVLGGIFKSEPDWNQLPADTPADIRRLLRRCLQKDAARRLKDAGTLKIEIEDVLNAPPSGPNPSAVIARPHKNRERLAWTLAAVALVAAAVLAMAYWRPVPPDTAVVRFTIPPPKKVFLSGTGVPEIAISPDGKNVAFVAEDGVRQLWVRAIDGVESRLMPGTDGAVRPFWSPDSKFIGFYAGGKLKKIALDGGSPQSICDVPQNASNAQGTWNRDGVIVFGFNSLYRVSAAGGQASPLTTLKDKETSHNLPFFLPDGQHFLYGVSSPQTEAAGVYVGSLDSKESKRILDVVGRTIYSAGHLLFVRDGKLMAQPFDPVRLETRGDPFLVADAVGASGIYSSMAVSDAGVLAYGGSSTGGAQQLAWFDRTGRQLETVGDPGPFQNFALSPDEKRLVIWKTDATTSSIDLWTAELSTGIFSRLTFDPASDVDPIWSPDSRTVVWFSRREKNGGLLQKTVGSQEETLLLEAPANGDSIWPDDWSPDGRFIIGNVSGKAIYALPTTGDRKPGTLFQSQYSLDEPHFSPDGRWVAYSTTESGQSEIYVASFQEFENIRQVSSGGGRQPRWRGDGKELFYLTQEGQLMSVDVSNAGAAMETTSPKLLFETRVTNPNADFYAPSSDGQKFLLLQPVEQTTATPITVVVNWLAGLNKK